jgi:hypothetical protein
MLFQAGEACVLEGWGNLHKMHRSPSSTGEDRPATPPPLCNAAAASAVRATTLQYPHCLPQQLQLQ